ncbi:sensor histidine kinase [Listeria aquatica]|uniref:histidine kinase n=1 Tax=Listeria aquatica FSL S10-1188 TaxID=1265818 RepID=W7BMY8_9LIST|nr:histidine kinase [Listeria aquatica]EUJ21353.1 integral membrane sensor signal transduction histidine kinase [Listeria aquatica FSL S10-1188]
MRSYKLIVDGFSGLAVLLLSFYLHVSSMKMALYLSFVLFYLTLLICMEFFSRYQLLLQLGLFILLIVSFPLGLTYYCLLFPSMLLTFLRQEEQAFSWRKLTILSILGVLPLILEHDDWFQLIYMFFLLGTIFVQFLLVKTTIQLTRKEREVERLRIKAGKLREQLDMLEAQRLEDKYFIQLEERNALSHRIHDELGHSLSGGLIQLEAAKLILQKDSQKAEELLTNAIQINQAGIESIRETLKEIKPPQESLGVTRLKQELKQFEMDYHIRSFLEARGVLEKITPPIWHCLQQNLTEGLTNILKHAEPVKVSVRLVVLNKFIRFEIQNDGKAPEQFTKSLGLVGMEERAAKLGGSVTFRAKNGFLVTTVIPIQ